MNNSVANMFQHHVRVACIAISRALLLCPFIIIISACHPDVGDFSKNPICQHPQKNNEYCSFTLGEQPFWLSASDPEMPIERGVEVFLQSDQEIQQLSAEIRGVSMYMGRLPVRWRQVDATTWRTEIMLGACTDPHMIWQLRLSIHGADSEQLEQKDILFQSYIPNH